ncbi:interleukin-12 receptor subunit beta-1-like [Hippoglossus hippoglossus]|uniref:interleukin-12 receptor subunit beta-1-like n=1 Tax=Hippoglossus hippoglossus TaxID=8267 RepID=UPI00148B3F9F|nr:interleukin-12 receptor subunit beta-1-like [Hippoglossus hippoglossus]
METLRNWSSLRGYFVFIFLTTVSKGSACEAPTSPECFKKNASESVYTCEWSMSQTDGNVTFDLYFNKTKFKGIYQTWRTIREEALIQRREVYIWVEAHVGNSSCSSPRRSVVLKDIVKYDAPQNISMSWSKNSLSLMWEAPEKHPALAEVWFRRDGHPAESWEKIFTKTNTDQVTVENLSQHSAHWVQIRQRSTQVKDPLWSHWSPVVIVPAELAHKPEVNVTIKRLNGTREVTLTWKLMSHAAAAAAGVTYRLEDTQSSLGCPCLRTEKRRQHLKTNNFTIYVSYSPVDISVIARNAAGCSPSATVHVPAEPTADLKTCDKTVDNKSSKKTCKQWYELQDGGLKPDCVITLESKKKQVREQERKSVALLQDYVGYLYFEHMCDVGKPRTVKTCLYYQKEGAPRREPQDITVFGQTHNSANLSWKAITSEDQRGFLTHYSLCSVKMGSRNEMRECHNISASLRKYSLENLTPGTKYNISLAVVTRAGAGPAARVTINTLQEKHMNVWLSLGLLIGFFFTSTMCTVVLKRIQNKIFPPVPTPVIPDFSPNQRGQEMLEGKEEVDELILLQLHPERKTVPQEAEETTTLRGEWDAGSDEDVENESEGDSRMSEGSGDESPGSTDQEQKSSRVKKLTDLEQVESEIAMLIYRNGLVFDLKTDSP